MIVKVIIKRHIKKGKTRNVFALLNRFRSDAMNQKGYISGETLLNYDNPREIVVIAMWQDMDNWLNWKNNSEREANEALLERWLEKSTSYNCYVFGTSFAQFKKRST